MECLDAQRPAQRRRLEGPIVAPMQWVAHGVAWLHCSACTAVTTVDLLPTGGAPATPTATASGGHSSVTAAHGGSGENASSSSSSAAGTVSTTGPNLLHRYDFSGTGTRIVDRVGGKDGAAMGGAVLDGTGQLELAGDALQYVQLPQGLIAPLTNLTLVSFITWHGGNAWQSVFNFGATDTGAPSEHITAQFFFTPLMQPGPGPSLHLNVAYGIRAQDSIDGTEAFPVDSPTVVVVVFNGERGQFSLYIDGKLILQPKSTDQRLADLDDTNAWLGQSQWAHDVEMSRNFHGSFDEFRIYDGCLSRDQIQSLTDPNRL